MTIIPRDQHIISRRNISDNALKVLYRLNKAGYEAYLVGGAVRDLLSGKTPKDFDIATSATPEQVRKLFRNCRLIGRRFRLAHVMFGAEIIEVATFRGNHDDQQESNAAHRGHNGMLLRDNTFGSVEEDAWRRDFTINSLYYSIDDFTVRDYVAGIADLRAGVIRLIGDPEVRYREDPVRMLRAVRFAAKLDMRISKTTAEPISRLAPLLRDVPAARLFEEALKLLQTGCGLKSWQLLRQYHLFELLFPSLLHPLDSSGESLTDKMSELVLESTDQRIQHGLRNNPAFLFAALFWYTQRQEAKQLDQQQNIGTFDAFAVSMNHTLHNACRTLAIPKRITFTMRDIWQLQLRLPARHGKRAWRLLEHEKFRAAYDLLAMRARVENTPELTALQWWWHQFQQADPAQQQALVNQATHADSSARRQPRQRKETPRSQLNLS